MAWGGGGQGFLGELQLALAGPWLTVDTFPRRRTQAEPAAHLLCALTIAAFSVLAGSILFFKTKTKNGIV